MTTNSGKKTRERAILNLFRKYYHEFPEGRVYDSESPDFIVRPSPKRSIGIELTGLPSPTYDTGDKSGYLELGTDILLSINKKEEKIKLYQKKHADEYWLVLHVDSFQPGIFNLRDYSGIKQINSLFDKIFLFELFDGRIFLLKKEKNEGLAP